MLPSKKSRQWIWVFILYTILIFIGLLVTRIILRSEIINSYLFGLLIVSLGSAFIPCVAGYFGKRVFFIIYSISALVGILYAFYVVLGNTAPGWGDLTSMIGYLFIVGIGAIIASIAEAVISIGKLNQD